MFFKRLAVHIVFLMLFVLISACFFMPAALAQQGTPPEVLPPTPQFNLPPVIGCMNSIILTTQCDINHIRLERGLNQLLFDLRLVHVARTLSWDMAMAGRVLPVTENGLATLLDEEQYGYTYVSHLTITYSGCCGPMYEHYFSDDILPFILDPNVTEIGVGVAVNFYLSPIRYVNIVLARPIL